MNNSTTKDESSISNCYEEKTMSFSLHLWVESGIAHYRGGSEGRQSYTYCTSTKDLIVSYGKEYIDKDWLDWIMKLNKLDDSQFIWVNVEECPFPTISDLLTNMQWLQTVRAAIVVKMDRLAAHNTDSKLNCQIKIKPFGVDSINEMNQLWCVMNLIKKSIDMLNEEQNEYLFDVSYDIASPSWYYKFGNKCCLHRFVNKLEYPSLFELNGIFDGSMNYINECLGYVCYNKKEILIGYDLLKNKLKHGNVVIKDPFGHSGEGIWFYKSRQDIIDNLEWSILNSCTNNNNACLIIEQDLRFDHNNSNSTNNSTNNNIKQNGYTLEWIGVSYYDGQIAGCGHKQILTKDFEFLGSKKYQNKLVWRKLKIVSQSIMKKLNCKYVGGFDFAVKINEKTNDIKFYLIDMNTGRHTATMQSFKMMEKFGIDINNDSKFFIRRNIKISKNLTFGTIICKIKPLMFNHTNKKGVYFHVWDSTSNVCIITIVADNEQQAHNFWARLSLILRTRSRGRSLL